MQKEKTEVVKVLYEVADVAAAGAVLLSLFTVANLQSSPHGIEPFLKARLTVSNAIMSGAFLMLWHSSFRIFGVYDAVGDRSFRQETRRVLAGSSVASLFALAFPITSRSHSFSWLLVVCFWLAATVTAIGFRGFQRALKKCIIRPARQVIIVGSGPRALSLYSEIEQKHKADFRVLGFIDSPNGHAVPEEVHRRMLGRLEDLDSILMNRIVDHVMIALPVKSCYDAIQRTIVVCEQAGVESEYLPDVFKLALARPHYGTLNDNGVVRLKVVQDGYRLVVKRLIDIVASSLALICFSPLMAIIAVAIRVASRGPIFFTQERYGLNKRRFAMWKFRTMVVDAEALQLKLEVLNEAQGPVFKIRLDPRITPVGRVLRKASLDELPQLFNVLRGDMSLVGPRPLPTRDVSRFDNPYLMRRFSVKPGLTGLWQVNGRSNADFSRWVSLDLEYIDKWSLALDLKILAKTVPAVVRGTGAA
jgi:exopolysaccharide biosynthesis polyprenyl glycosylphosphotransferase